VIGDLIRRWNVTLNLNDQINELKCDFRQWI
jgi:hypothetical protein